MSEPEETNEQRITREMAKEPCTRNLEQLEASQLRLNQLREQLKAGMLPIEQEAIKIIESVVQVLEQSQISFRLFAAGTANKAYGIWDFHRFSYQQADDKRLAEESTLCGLFADSMLGSISKSYPRTYVVIADETSKPVRVFHGGEMVNE